MPKNDEINEYVPSILRPRAIRKDDYELSSTQISTRSQLSLSLKRHKIPLGSTVIKAQRDKENILQKQSNTKKINFLKGDDNDFEPLIVNIDSNVSPFVKNCNETIKQQCNLTQSHSFIINGKEKDANISSENNPKPQISLSFGFIQCNSIEVVTKNNKINKFSVSYDNNNVNVDCDIVETMSTSDISSIKPEVVLGKRLATKISTELEIKKQKLSTDKILLLKTDANNKLSHVIVQPINYKLLKRDNSEKPKFIGQSGRSPGIVSKCVTVQKSIVDYLRPNDRNCSVKTLRLEDNPNCLVTSEYGGTSCEEMNKASNGNGVRDRPKTAINNILRKEADFAPRSARVLLQKRERSPPAKHTQWRASSGRHSASSDMKVEKGTESLQTQVSKTSNSNKSTTRGIPQHKIVLGTHFAVDAFSYGDIPNVKHYFLTHFHSDHYAGLKKTFNNVLLCSKITSDLCISRLGVNPKYIQILNIDETIKVDEVSVTAVEANHCPGALMLVFTLPSGKSVLHTGDFRATPEMESYPALWNNDIHTIYLDTTYCHPRFDFPTQDQSLDMAVQLLRQKKISVEKNGKKFSSVLIVCGTYTIGKEKFFLGLARAVGCTVWACADKDRVLRAVEGRSFTHAPPHACQLHVMPMRDVTHEKLREYLDGLQPAFSEIIAFKPSGWESEKNSNLEQDSIVIHGIPYSEHSSFSEMVRFVKFLRPKQVIPTVDIAGGVKVVQKYFPCPLGYKNDQNQSNKITDYYVGQNRQRNSTNISRNQ